MNRLDSPLTYDPYTRGFIPCMFPLVLGEKMTPLCAVCMHACLHAVWCVTYYVAIVA